jgi:type IV secretion system protein VirD4
VVVFVKGQPPIYGRKAFYYENPVLLARASIPPPAQSARLRIPALVEDVEVKSLPAKVETAADRWVASRVAMQQRIGRPQAPANGVTQVLGGDKKVSRYADKVTAISAEERRQIETLVSSVALTDKVVAVSAF